MEQRVARLFDTPQELVQEAVRGFGATSPLGNMWAPYEGVRFYDDAISTTPESTGCLEYFGSDSDAIFGWGGSWPGL